jgi:hypothetical protein
LSEIFRFSSHKKFRALPDPPVIKSDMVRNEIEQEVDPSSFEALPEVRQLSVTTKYGICHIFAHRKR